MMSPIKEMGPTTAVATAMASVTPSSRRRDASVVVHAQVDGLLLAQGEHVQQRQIPAEKKHQQGQHHQGKRG